MLLLLGLVLLLHPMCFCLAYHYFLSRLKSDYNSCMHQSFVLYMIAIYVHNLGGSISKCFNTIVSYCTYNHAYHHKCNSPTTEISHLIHLSSGPVATFSLKIHASINVACAKVLKSFVAIVRVTRINNQPTVHACIEAS